MQLDGSLSTAAIWQIDNNLFQPYERMNVADALVTQHYDDGDVIIKQVRRQPAVLGL